MKIGVPGETYPGEKRVATTPDVAGQLIKLGFDVSVEAGAGAEASFSDEAFLERFNPSNAGHRRRILCIALLSYVGPFHSLCSTSGASSRNIARSC